jgi:hypothetical protein
MAVNPYEAPRSADAAAIEAERGFAAEAERILWMRAYRIPWSAARNPLEVMALALFKLLRVQAGGGAADFPCVRDLADFRVEPEAVSFKARTALAPVIDRLMAQGFHTPAVHRIDHPLDVWEVVLVTMTDGAGITARAICKVPKALYGPRHFVQYWSEMPNGRTLLTWGKSMECAPPSGWEVDSRSGRGEERLLADHRERLSAVGAPRALTGDEAVAAVEARHREMIAAAMEQEVFRPLTPKQVKRYVALRRTGKPSVEFSWQQVVITVVAVVVGQLVARLLIHHL